MKSLIKTFAVFVLLITVSGCSTRHQLIEPNESLLFGFETKDGNRAVLVKDQEENLLTFRFGKQDSVGVEYPLRQENEPADFIYSPTRDSIGNHSLTFEVGGMVYKITEPMTQDMDPFISVNNKHSGEENLITARIHSKEGSLKNLMNSGLTNLKTLEL